MDLDAWLPAGAIDAPPYSQAWFDALERLLGASLCRQLGCFVVPDDFRLSVVVPVFNERATLRTIVERICSVPIRKEIILVDDGSTDGSWELLETLVAESSDDDSAAVENEIRLVRHERNCGKGAALRTGFERAHGDVVLVQDADLEYDPAEYPRLLRPIVAGEADVVLGTRFLGDRPHRVLYFWHAMANRMLTTASNMLTDLNLTDMEAGYKLFRREVIADIAPTLRERRFGFEPEIVAKVARRKYRVFEVSISYHGRTYAQGKKVGLRDGLRALWCIVRYAWFD